MKLFLSIINTAFLIIGILIYNKNKSQDPVESSDLSLIDLEPAEISYFYHNIQYISRAILSTMLSLYNRGIVDIKRYERDSRNKNIADYVVEHRFTLLDKNGQISTIERELLNLIFDETDIIDTDILTKKSISLGQKYFKNWDNWVEIIKSSLIDKGLIKGQYSSYHKRLLVLGAAMTAVGLYSIFNKYLVGILGLVSAMVVLLIGISGSVSMTNIGTQYYQLIEKTYNDLKDRTSPGTTDIDEFLRFLALGRPIDDYKDIFYPESDIIDLVLKDLNQNGGAFIDDSFMRGFLGFRKPTSGSSLDTNRPTIKK